MMSNSWINTVYFILVYHHTTWDGGQFVRVMVPVMHAQQTPARLCGSAATTTMHHVMPRPCSWQRFLLRCRAR